MTNLFEPLQLGDFVLSNPIILAPMTRSRSDANGRRKLGGDHDLQQDQRCDRVSAHRCRQRTAAMRDGAVA